jgi:hypothetical protein
MVGMCDGKGIGDLPEVSALLEMVVCYYKPVDVHFLCHSRKENEPKEKAKSERMLPPLPAGS